MAALRTLLALLSISPGHGGAALPSVFVTTADGQEGLAMAQGLLAARKFHVIAGVSAVTSPAAQQLASAGAELRSVGEPPEPSVFEGSAWVFVLAPLTADRLQRGRSLITAARKGGVKSAALLSVVGAGDGAPSSLGAYYSLEKHLEAEWAKEDFVVLRTFFYQENLLLWAADARANGELRLPLSTACFAPLFRADVADALAAIMLRGPPPGGRVLDLTGPRAMGGVGLAEVASKQLEPPGLSFLEVNRSAAAGVLERAGGLDPSEASLVLDLLLWQAGERFCGRWPSRDFSDVTGRPATDASVFFAQNAKSFQPAAGATGRLLVLVE